MSKTRAILGALALWAGCLPGYDGQFRAVEGGEEVLGREPGSVLRDQDGEVLRHVARFHRLDADRLERIGEVHHVLRAVNRGARLIVVDPRRTGSAEWADLWLGLDVGSDIALANAMAKVILDEGLEHAHFVAHATRGFEDFRRALAGVDWAREVNKRRTKTRKKRTAS